LTTRARNTRAIANQIIIISFIVVLLWNSCPKTPPGAAGPRYGYRSVRHAQRVRDVVPAVTLTRAHCETGGHASAGRLPALRHVQAVAPLARVSRCHPGASPVGTSPRRGSHADGSALLLSRVTHVLPTMLTLFNHARCGLVLMTPGGATEHHRLLPSFHRGRGRRRAGHVVRTTNLP
jgi:hypothetical protein